MQNDDGAGVAMAAFGSPIEAATREAWRLSLWPAMRFSSEMEPEIQ
jgi:hypothetical protein